MKKPLLLLVLSGLGFYCPIAQTLEASYDDTYAANISYVFENLNMSEVATNLLADRAVPFIEVDSFDGVQLLEYNKLEINQFGLLYASFYSAALDTSALLPHPDRYMKANDSLQTGDPIPLSVLHLDYHRFRKDAIDLNLLFVQDSQLHDTPNRPQSPYLQKKAFGVTPLMAATDTLDVAFSLPDSLVFTNTTGIALFEIDLDDGNGYQIVGFNDTITANYEEEGEKELLFRVTLADSTVHYGHAAFYASGTGTNSNLQNGLNKNYSTNQDTVITIDATADHESADIEVLYGCKNLGMRKPLVYIQGYKPQIGNKPQDHRFMTGEKRFGQDIPQGGRILDALEAEGYDLIFIKLGYPGDFIGRNAQVVKKAIKKINELKNANGSHEELIVIGSSMGGVVGKYALLEMERDDENHEVKTFISMDSPFRGANLPVGAQFMTKHLLNTSVTFLAGTVDVGTTNLLSFVDEVGQTQTAIHEGFIQNTIFYNLFEMPSIFGTVPNNLTGFDLTNPNHTQFLAEFEALGELQDCDFVALSNGSSIGEGQGFEPSDKLVQIKGGTADLLGLSELGGAWPDILAGLGWVFRTGIRFDLNIHALPDNPSSYKKVYKGSTKIIVLGGIAVQWTSFEGKVKETVPYDNAPGSTVPIMQDGLPGFVTIHHLNACWVPVVSSLSLNSPHSDSLFKDLSDVKSISPIDRYDASTDDGFENLHNQRHPSLNFTNIPFLLAELISGDSLQTLPTNANGELVLGDRTYNYGDASGGFNPNAPTLSHTPNQLKDTLWVKGLAYFGSTGMARSASLTIPTLTIPLAPTSTFSYRARMAVNRAVSNSTSRTAERCASVT